MGLDTEFCTDMWSSHRTKVLESLGTFFLAVGLVLQIPYPWEAMPLSLLPLLRNQLLTLTGYPDLGLAAAPVLGLFLQHVIWSSSTLVPCWLAHLSKWLLLSYMSHPAGFSKPAVTWSSYNLSKKVPCGTEHSFVIFLLEENGSSGRSSFCCVTALLVGRL